MAYLKMMSSHVSAVAIKKYLEHDGRALCVDYQNLSAPVVGYDLYDLVIYGHHDWAQEMDRTRKEAGNDQAWGDKPTRTFLHCILSPDPKDHVELSTLRLIATRWVGENFPDHQAAFVYHDDNQHHILHAHIIINNTNLKTGKRFCSNNARILSQSMQTIARNMGLFYFSVAGRDGDPHIEERTNKRSVGCAERKLTAQGTYSWVADIRFRVDIARDSSATERKFCSALEMLGVALRNSHTKKSGGWVYSLEGRPSHEVSGARLGTIYTREGVLSRMGSPIVEPLAHQLTCSVLSAAKDVIELRSLSELRRLSLTVELIRSRSLRSISGIDHAIDKAKKRGRDAELAGLRDARACCEKYSLLPRESKETSPRQRFKAHKTKRRSNLSAQILSSTSAQVQRETIKQINRDRDERRDLR